MKKNDKKYWKNIIKKYKNNTKNNTKNYTKKKLPICAHFITKKPVKNLKLIKLS